MPEMVRRTWVPDPNAYGPRSAREPFTYEAYVPDPIAPLELRIGGGVAAELEAAAVAVRELQTGTNVGGLEAVSRQLLRSEALASSRIEGLEMSHRRIAKALSDAAAVDETARSVIANIRAMEQAIALASQPRPVALDDILAIHDTLMVLPRERSHAGRLREGQNWLGTSDSPRDAEFIPPPEDQVPLLMQDLVTFLERGDLSPIAQAAISHAQFETIHPFVDGNGRVGRALIHVVLRRRNVASRFVPPVSVVLATNRGRYVERLTAYRRGDIDAWCTFFARCLAASVSASRTLGERIGELQAQWTERARQPRRDSATTKLIAVLPESPVLDVRTAQLLAAVTFKAANAAVDRLVQARVLVPVREGRRRDRRFEAPEITALLDDFDRAAATPTRTAERPRPAPPARA